MPALSSEIYGASNGFASSPPVVPVEEEVPFIPLQQPTPAQKEEEAFIVKRGGKKRKSDAISDQMKKIRPIRRLEMDKPTIPFARQIPRRRKLPRRKLRGRRAQSREKKGEESS